MFSDYFSRILLFIWLSSGAFLAQADTLTVTSLDDAGAGTLRSAIGLAASGDTIDFQAGLSGVITLESPLPVLNQDVTIQGPGAGVITISGNDQHRVFFVESGTVVVISGLTIADGLTDFEIGDPDTNGLGGGILNAGDLTLEECVVQDSFAEFIGGGISNEGTLSVLRTTITRNSTAVGGTGGGIDNFIGVVEIVESTVSDNGADFGGGVFNDGGELQLEASTISGNVAAFGGGISNTAGTLMVFNSTVSGNSASDAGGGIENLDGTTLLFSTVAENAASSGGGVLNDGDFTGRNSLIVNSPTGDDCVDSGSSFNATGNNLDTDGTCPAFGQTTATPLALGSLADNGGPTATHALGETSVAVDAAVDCTDIDGTTSIDGDQRSVVRPQRAACDIGAFELADAGDSIFADRFEGP